MPDVSSPTRESIDYSLRELFNAEQSRLRANSKLFSKAASAIEPLTRQATWDDLGRLEKVLAKLEKGMPAEIRQEAGIEAILARAEEYRQETPKRLRGELSATLPSLCGASGLPCTVVSREEPFELRIAPLSVVLDFEKGLAHLQFARLVLATCPADAKSILESRAKVVGQFEKDFEPAAFFDRAYAAWRAARAARGARASGESDVERVEINDYLPYLALEMQAKRFRSDPKRENYRAYGRAEFAYHVHLLRERRMLTKDDLRINLGVATGTTAQQKKRVIYFEDGNGNGEFKLTVFFTRIDGGARA